MNIFKKNIKHTQHYEKLVCLGVLTLILLSFIARMYNAYDAAPHGDENGTYFWISHSVREILYGSGTWLTMHWYILAVKALDQFGVNLNQLRTISLLFAAIGWWFCYITVRARTQPILALAAVSLVVAVPAMYGIERSELGYDAMIRSYSLVFMLVCICAYFFGRWSEEGKLRFLIGFFGFASTACILSLPVALFFISIIPILILIHYRDNVDNSGYLRVLKKDGLSVLIVGLIAVIFCYIAQMTYLENMLNAHSKFIWADKSGLDSALEGLFHFYKGKTLVYGALFAASLSVILFYRKYAAFAAVVLCFLICIFLIYVLHIDHKPWAFGRIFYRYFHLIFVGTTIYAIHLVTIKHQSSGLMLAVIIIVHGYFFTLSNLHESTNKGLNLLYKSYVKDFSFESNDTPLFIVDGPKQHWISSVAQHKELVVSGYKGVSLERLASDPIAHRKRAIVVLTKFCNERAVRQFDDYCSYEYRATKAQSALDELVSDLISKMESGYELGNFISHSARRKRFLNLYNNRLNK